MTPRTIGLYLCPLLNIKGVAIMFPVSAYYLNSILNGDRRWQLKAEISLSNSSSLLTTLVNSDFVTQTLQVSRQSTNSSSFTIGGVCATKLNLSLNYQGIAKVKAVSALKKGYCFRLILWLKTSDLDQSDTDYSKNRDESANTTGRVDLGYFYIYNIKNSDYQCDLELYDAMLAFDRDITYQDQIYLYQGAKTITEWLELFCTSCSTANYQLSLANGVASKILNNSILFSIGNDSTLKSYRDAIGYLSILAGGFATINRSGKLDIEIYKTTSLLEVEHNNVVDYNVDDNLYRIAKLSTSIAGFEYTAYNSNAQLGALGAEIFLDENPFLRSMQPEDGEELQTSIKDILDSIMAGIEDIFFYGGNYQILGRPELDVGDCITIKTKVLDKTNNTMVDKTYPYVLVCGHNWSYQTWSSIKCNSYIEVTSKSKPTSSFKGTGGGGGGGGASNATVGYTGTKDISLLANRASTLFDILYLAKADVAAHAAITVVADITTVGTIAFRITHNNVIQFLAPKWTLTNTGYFTFSFDIMLEAAEVDMQHSLLVEVVSSQGLTADIDQLQYQLIITASGVKNGEPSWTGRYELSDEVPQYIVALNNPIKYTGFSETINPQLNV